MRAGGGSEAEEMQWVLLCHQPPLPRPLPTGNLGSSSGRKIQRKDREGKRKHGWEKVH